MRISSQRSCRLPCSERGSQGCFLFLFIALSLGVYHGESFQASFGRPISVPTRSAQAYSLHAEKKDGVENDSPNGSRKADGKAGRKKVKRRRNVDFPSFCYDSTRVYPYAADRRKKLGREQFLIRFPGATGERIFRTSTPKVVSVPQKRRKELSIAEQLLRALFSPFDPYLMNIAQSASQSRLLNDRAYARPEPFELENLEVPPNLDDLLSIPKTNVFDGVWISVPARLTSFFGAYFIFPYIARHLNYFVTMPPEQLDEITGKFAPGISILYGTFISLTLSILYNRQRNIQDNVALECSLLSFNIRNLLSLLKDDREKSIEAGQCTADQIRTLVRSSRGAELMLLMYSDPYARMQEVIDTYEEELTLKENALGAKSNLLAICRDTLKDMNKVRAKRLSDEALALPPTHFLILNLLTLLILLGYTISILPTVSKFGDPSNESCLLFGLLSTIYILFYNFASDLNNPFRGVYQVRRSCAASHLLEAKWLIANHPNLRGEVDFEEVEEDPTGVRIRSPGLGDLWFERDDIYADGDLEEV